MQCKSERGSKIRGFAKLVVLASVSAAIPGLGQTAADLAGKYPVVSAYEVRPGVLLTAKYAEDGQACELVLEARHYQTPAKIELRSTIPPKLEDTLIDELVPMSERGEPKRRWSNKEPRDAWVDPDSFSAGGVSYVKRSYENVTIEEHGYYVCHENPRSTKSKDKLDCSEGGDEVVVIRWTKRTCGKTAGLGQMVPAGSGGVTAGNRGTDKGETEARTKSQGRGESRGGRPECLLTKIFAGR
jgi:hypothetical protein